MVLTNVSGVVSGNSSLDAGNQIVRVVNPSVQDLSTEMMVVGDAWSGSKSSRKPIEGLASFYDDYFEDKDTASGETFHQNLKTGAMPFGFRPPTWVIVESLDVPERSLWIRINDKGPFQSGSGGSINSSKYKIDLSKAGFIGVGGVITKDKKGKDVGETRVRIIFP